MMIRFFDLFLSVLALIILSPILLLISLLIFLTSKGKILFFQKRVGKNNREFTLIKFRTMIDGSENHGSLTIGEKDERITGIGAFLRKYKLDEFPQLINVISGDMSIVGPRPEVRKFVDLYNEEQKKVLQLKPGLTDYASVEFINENEILGNSTDPEKTYIREIMPAKLELNKKYLLHPSLRNYFQIIGMTIRRLLL